MAITPLPTPPSRSQSPATFSTDADAFLGALPDFATEANALAADVNADEASAAAAATAAANSANIAVGAANYQGNYNAGTTYQIGQSVSSGGRQWVAKTINTGITPVEGANWLLINDGDVLGPVSATNNALAVYDGTTGKIIKNGPAPGAVNNVLVSNGTTWTSGSAPSSPVNYTQNIQSANYTLVLGDAGKQIFHPVADTSTRTYTIPANASVPFPIGTVVLFTVENGGIPVTVAITSDTLVFGAGTTGSISLLGNNTLMCIKVTATKWMANYLYQTGPVASFPQSIALANDASPYVIAYPWSNSGFGTKFANPATLPANSLYSVAFTAAGNAIALSGFQLDAYGWSSAGFGTKFANPATLPIFGYGIAFTPAGNAIAVADNQSPFIVAYPWSGSGFGTKFTNPATLPAGGGRSVAFSPASDAIAVAHATSPYISVYPWSVSGFGTKFADPATLPTGTGNGVAFSPAGDAVAVAHNTSPHVTVYPWSGSGFGTKFANPATLVNDRGASVTFHPSGNAIAVANTGSSPYVTVYPWSGSGFGTKYTNPVTTPTGGGNGIAFNPAGTEIAVAHTNSPYVTAYPWSGSGFGTKFADPATLPAATSNGVAFTNNF